MQITAGCYTRFRSSDARILPCSLVVVDFFVECMCGGGDHVDLLHEVRLLARS